MLALAGLVVLYLCLEFAAMVWIDKNDEGGS